MNTITLAGQTVPALGMGSWRLGQNARPAREEIAALQAGLDAGMRVIDTAEMYGDGASERLIGQAIQGQRERVFLVSKVYPYNAGGRALEQSCHASLSRLGVECLDLYLLHWPGSIPLEETLDGFERLRAAGKIRAWGISNFNVDETAELLSLAGAEACATNQVLYNPGSRGIEFDLLPLCRQHAMPVMAYSPLGSGNRLLRHPLLAEIGVACGVSASAVALAWAMRNHDVLAVAESGDAGHTRSNAAALELSLDVAMLAALDAAFAPPTQPMPLDIL